jgi:hypothetical protein
MVTKWPFFARNQEKLDGQVAELGAEGITAAGFAADVTKDASIKAAFAAAKARFGQIDVLEYSPVQIPASMADYAPLGVIGPDGRGGAEELLHHRARCRFGGWRGAAKHAGARHRLKGFAPMIAAWAIGGAALRNYSRKRD